MNARDEHCGPCSNTGMVVRAGGDDPDHLVHGVVSSTAQATLYKVEAVH